MGENPLCVWCGDTGHSLSDCPIAPELADTVDANIAEGLKMVKRFNKMANGDFCREDIEDE